MCSVQIVRFIKALQGHPRITVRLRPVSNYGSESARITRGSNHGMFSALHFTFSFSSSHFVLSFNTHF